MFVYKTVYFFKRGPGLIKQLFIFATPSLYKHILSQKIFTIILTQSFFFSKTCYPGFQFATNLYTYCCLNNISLKVIYKLVQHESGKLTWVAFP